MIQLIQPQLLLWGITPVLAIILFPFLRENTTLFPLLNNALELTVLLFSIVVHEVAHGWSAYKNGDDTAFKQGRLTLNLIPHVSPFGTIILPLILHLSHASFMIGWAKPVPFQPVKLNRYPRDIAALALAGPMSNFILATIAFFLLLGVKLFISLYSPGWAEVAILAPADSLSIIPTTLWAGTGFVTLKILSHAIIINIVLGVFNLIPFPPLDGFWVFKSIMPKAILSVVTKVQQFGFLILIVAVNTGVFTYLLYPAMILISTISELLGTLS